MNKKDTITILSTATGGITGAGIFTGAAFVVAPYATAPLFLTGLIAGVISGNKIGNKIQHKFRISEQIDELNITKSIDDCEVPKLKCEEEK